MTPSSPLYFAFVIEAPSSVSQLSLLSAFFMRPGFAIVKLLDVMVNEGVFFGSMLMVQSTPWWFEIMLPNTLTVTLLRFVIQQSMVVLVEWFKSLWVLFVLQAEVMLLLYVVQSGVVQRID